MGRRALRKISPELDLSQHLLTFEELPDPWSQSAVFPNDAPLEVEIGSGKGLFLETATEQRPDHNFLGIEIARRYARHCAARLAKKARPNGRVLSGDALRFFSELLPDDCLSAIHVYFPDPWWKLRHRKRRVMNKRFLADIVRTLLPGGSLHFWTDVEEYYRDSVDLILGKTTLVGPQSVAECPAFHTLDYRTHFERRTRLNAEPVYRSEFVKPVR